MGWSRKERLKIAQINGQRIFGAGITSRRTKVECAKCREVFPLKIMEVHHKRAKSRGGTDNYGNLALLCPPCNKKVGAKVKEKRSRGRSIFDRIFGR